MHTLYDASYKRSRERVEIDSPSFFVMSVVISEVVLVECGGGVCREMFTVLFVLVVPSTGIEEDRSLSVDRDLELSIGRKELICSVAGQLKASEVITILFGVVLSIVTSLGVLGSISEM